MRMFMILFVACVLAAAVVFGSLMWLDEDFNDAFRQKWNTWTKGEPGTAYSRSNTHVKPDEWTLARQAARQLAGKCEDLAKEQAGDADTLLGIAFIYKYFPERKCPYDIALDRVLVADPCNLAAIAMKTELETGVWLARAQYDIVAMDRIFGARQTGGATRVRIGPEDEPFYSMIKHDDPFVESGTSPLAGTQGRALYYINDTATARGVFVERIQAKLPQFLEKIDAASAMDPDNAFYDYLKARLCFEMWQRDKGLECVKAALGKKVVQNYVEEARTQAAKIMKSERYPKVCRDYIASAGITSREYIAVNICRSWLDEMVRERRIRGNLAGAREMSQLLAQVQKQCGIENDKP